MFSICILPIFLCKFYTTTSFIHVTYCVHKKYFHNQLICQWLCFSCLVQRSDHRDNISLQVLMECVMGLMSPLPISTAHSNGKDGRRGKKEQDKGRKNTATAILDALENLYSIFNPHTTSSSTPVLLYHFFLLSPLIIALAFGCQSVTS